MIPSPIIVYPKTNWTTMGTQIYYSSDLRQSISGYVPLIAEEITNGTAIIVKYRYKIDRNGVLGEWSTESSANISVGYINSFVSSIPWSFYTDGIIELEEGDIFTIEFKAYLVDTSSGSIGDIIDYSDYSSITAYIVKESDIQVSVVPLTGLKVKRYNNSIKVLVPKTGVVVNEDCDFCGCNFYLSLTPGSDYVLINNVPVTETDILETEKETLVETSYTDTVNKFEMTTTGSRIINKEYYTCTIDKNVIAKLIQEGKIPNIFLADGETLSNDVFYYFVATVQVFNKVLNQLIESSYSEELEAQFLRYVTDYQTLPKRSRSDILFSIARDLMLSNDKINVVPGSVFRDLIDPIALELEKLYIIEDFVFTCLSLDTLVAFDDEDGDGISDPINVNLRKKALANALGLKDPSNLQLLIDEQFDKYASNYNMTRKGATKAIGTVIFYTDIRPTEDILIVDGTVLSTSTDYNKNNTPVKFVTKGTVILGISNADNYYNPSTKRYEIVVNIEAQESGEKGNVPAGAITSVLNVIPTLKVINNEPTRYGTNRETNRQLADRIKNSKAVYDTGTEKGYIAAALDIPGVLQVKVQKAGDPLMMRDYDVESKQHIGGKVDVYIKGRRPQQYIDQLAFSYEYPADTTGMKKGETFYVLDASEFKFKCKNPKVTIDSPIILVTKVRNISRNKEYSLNNYKIIGEGDIILLEKNLYNTSIGLSTFDVIEVQYYYRSTNLLLLSKQPVDSIVSITTSNGTIVDPSKYRLVKLDDPLGVGNSSISRDAVQFLFKENDFAPEFINITDEEHEMLINVPAKLLLKGVEIDSIEVKSLSGEVFINNLDYSIIPGSNIEYTYLELLSNSKIRHGDRVLVSYRAIENFNVTYIVNDLINYVQEKVNNVKHACADVIVKQGIRNFVDIGVTVIRKQGVDLSLLKSRIKTALTNYITQLKMGDSLTQSSVAYIIKNVAGVKDIKIPFTRMMKRNNSFISLDPVGYTAFEIYSKSSSTGITAYRTLRSVLRYKTTENGGDKNLFRGVYEDKKLLKLVDKPTEVANGLGRAYIQADGKIIVSTTDNNIPQTKYYHVSYYSYYSSSENVVEDITTSEIEYLDIDSQSLVIEVIDG